MFRKSLIQVLMYSLLQPMLLLITLGARERKSEMEGGGVCTFIIRS